MRQLEAPDAGQLDELSPEEVLEALRRECLAYVAEHYEPIHGDEYEGDKYEGSNSDDEHIWTEALEHVLGSDEWWEEHSGDPESWTDPGSITWNEEELERYTTVVLAWTAIAKIGMIAGRDLVHQERLFGKAAERPEILSPEWTALYVSSIPGDADDARLRRFDMDVANYLSNVRGGLVEATGMFYDLEEDE